MVLSQNAVDDFLQSVKAFERTFNCYVSCHDYCGEIRGAVSLLPFVHVNPFCSIVKYKRIHEVHSKCGNFDRGKVEARLVKKMEPFYKVCHWNVLELIMPVLLGDRLAGVLFIGPFRFETPPVDALMSDKMSSWEKFKKQREHLAFVSKDDYENIKGMAKLIAHRLAVLIETNRIPRAPEKSGRKERIKRYIEMTFPRRDSSLGGLAEYLSLSESRITQLLKEYFGMGFPELLVERRLQRAKALLANSYFSSAIISDQCGFSEPNYFFRVFKKKTGMTPGEYRKKHRSFEEDLQAD